MSLRHAVLGLLAHGPASGYDLLGTFQGSLANVWPATQSQLYGELNRLADAGLITVAAEGPRGRKEYALTEAGMAELKRMTGARPGRPAHSACTRCRPGRPADPSRSDRPAWTGRK